MSREELTKTELIAFGQMMARLLMDTYGWTDETEARVRDIVESVRMGNSTDRGEAVLRFLALVDGSNSHPTPTSSQVRSSAPQEEEVSPLVLMLAMERALQSAWDDVCLDSGCHPDCFRREGKELTANFAAGGAFTRLAAGYLARDLHLPAPAPQEDTRDGGECIWTRDEFGDPDFYETSCGQEFTFNEGTASDNGVKFCHHCGKPMREVKVNTDEDDSEEDEAVIIDAALSSNAPIPEKEPEQTPEVCMDCDGCGWTEGGKTLQTKCEKCGGTGEVPRRRPSGEEKHDAT